MDTTFKNAFLRYRLLRRNFALTFWRGFHAIFKIATMLTITLHSLLIWKTLLNKSITRLWRSIRFGRIIRRLWCFFLRMNRNRLFSLLAHWSSMKYFSSKVNNFQSGKRKFSRVSIFLKINCRNWKETNLSRHSKRQMSQFKLCSMMTGSTLMIQSVIFLSTKPNRTSNAWKDQRLRFKSFWTNPNRLWWIWYLSLSSKMSSFK